MTEIRVLLVDDHPVVLTGLAAVLSGSADIRVVGSAGDGSSALEAARALQPDVVLLDLQIPGPSGPELIESIRRESAGSRVLIVTASDDDDDLAACMKAGAAGYLLKGVDAAQLIGSIQLADAGEIALTPSLTKRLVARMREAETRPAPPGPLVLTPRELETLQHLVNGGTNEQIARRMFVSPRTVKAHLASTFAKLGVSDRTAAVALAIRTGIVDDDTAS